MELVSRHVPSGPPRRGGRQPWSNLSQIGTLEHCGQMRSAWSTLGHATAHRAAGTGRRGLRATLSPPAASHRRWRCCYRAYRRCLGVGAGRGSPPWSSTGWPPRRWRSLVLDVGTSQRGRRPRRGRLARRDAAALGGLRGSDGRGRRRGGGAVGRELHRRRATCAGAGTLAPARFSGPWRWTLARTWSCSASAAPSRLPGAWPAWIDPSRCAGLAGVTRSRRNG